MNETNCLFPRAGLATESVLYAYSGSRPLLRTGTRRLNRASRGHALVDHERTDAIAGLLTMAGGKLSTAPSFADEAVRRVESKLGLTPRLARPRKRAQCAESADPGLSSIHGSRAAELLRFLVLSADRAQPVCKNCATTRGEVIFALERERASTLGDILLRRTGLAFDPSYERCCAERVAETVAPLLGWDRARAEHAVAEFETELAANLAREWRSGGEPQVGYD